MRQCRRRSTLRWSVKQTRGRAWLTGMYTDHGRASYHTHLLWTRSCWWRLQARHCRRGYFLGGGPTDARRHDATVRRAASRFLPCQELLRTAKPSAIKRCRRGSSFIELSLALHGAAVSLRLSSSLGSSRGRRRSLATINATSHCDKYST